MSESKSTALAVTGGVRIDGLGGVFQLADRLAKARGFVPDHLAGNADSIAAVVLTGIELGMGPMESMRGIHIVKGKPTMSSELMLARARKAGVKTRWLETTDRIARLAVTVPGDDAQVMAFSMEDAARAGIAGDMWKRYPANMLRARCVSNALRAFCPEVLGSGVYEADSGELSDGVPSVEVIARDVTPVTYELGSGDRGGDLTDDALTALEQAGDLASLEAAKRIAKGAYKAARGDEREAIALAVRVAEERISASTKEEEAAHE